MTYRIAGLIGLGMVIAAHNGMAQGQAPAALSATTPAPAPQTAKPVTAQPALVAKPVVVWRPKAISKSQLQPMLKPDRILSDTAANEAFVPVSQVNPLAAAAPPAQVTLVSTHAGVPTTEASAAPNDLPAAVTFADFKGRYLGAGVEVALAPAEGEAPRRMSQVIISGDPQEFTVKWATMKIGANFRPEAVKSSEQSLTFRPSGAPNRYVAIADAAGQPAPDANAVIDGRTMVVTLTTKLDNGTPSIQRYERTLTQAGMDVNFTRTENGAVVRQVNLTLTKGSSGVW